jgi:hypothetical protein
MNDLLPPPVPQLSDEWISSRQIALTDALSLSRGVGVKWGTLAGATGVAATVSVLTAVLIAGGAPHTPRVTPYAFAGWRASPTTPTDAQLTAADSTCQSALARLSGTNTAADVASFVPELSDERGPFTVTVFGNGGQDAAMCLFVANAIQVRWLEESGMAVDPGAIAVNDVSSLDRDGQPYTLVEGQTGTGVTGITLSLADGSSVTASSGNGLFVAWWPGSQTITSATVATAGGTTTQTVNLAGPGEPASPDSPPNSAVHNS